MTDTNINEMTEEEIEIEELVTLDCLTTDSVSILKQEFANIDGEKIQVGSNWRCACINSESGRLQARELLDDVHYNSLIAIWGPEPTIIEDEPEITPTV